MGVLKVRVNGAWEEVTTAVPEEVVISVDDPYLLDPLSTAELWFDPDEVRPPTIEEEVYVGPVSPDIISPLNKVDLWYDPDDDVTSAGEVFIGPDDPDLTTPGIELWYDTLAVATQAPPELPPGGAGGTALTKASANDGDVRWGGDLNTGSIFPASGEVIQFPNVTGPKINLYSTTFGLGVESGETSIFASSKVGFHTNTSNGALMGYVDANTGGGLIIDRDACDARYAQNVQSRSNSGFLSLPASNLTGSYVTVYNTPISYPSGNRRIKVTVQLKVNPGAEQHILIKCFGQETSFTKHAVMADTIGPAVFVNNGASGTSSGVVVEVKSDTGNGSIVGDGSSWVLVEDLGPR